MPFAFTADNVLHRFAVVRVSASMVFHCTEGQGGRLRAQQKEERMVQPMHRGKAILYEQGGEVLLAYLRALELPSATPAKFYEVKRKLIGYFQNNWQRMDYPTYRHHGRDIGSGPTKAGCTIIGERLRGAGICWVEEGRRRRQRGALST